MNDLEKKLRQAYMNFSDAMNEIEKQYKQYKRKRIMNGFVVVSIIVLVILFLRYLIF